MPGALGAVSSGWSLRLKGVIADAGVSFVFEIHVIVGAPGIGWVLQRTQVGGLDEADAVRQRAEEAQEVAGHLLVICHPQDVTNAHISPRHLVSTCVTSEATGLEAETWCNCKPSHRLRTLRKDPLACMTRVDRLLIS
jgi:hypothetical protein